MGIIRTAQASGGGVHVDAGTYTVTVVNLVEDQLEDPQFGDGRIIRFDLELNDMVAADGGTLALDAIASDKLSPRSKLWGWLKALGADLEIGRSVDFDTVIGQQCLAVLSDKTTADGAVFSRVDDLIPLPRGARQPAAVSIPRAPRPSQPGPVAAPPAANVPNTPRQYREYVLGAIRAVGYTDEDIDSVASGLFFDYPGIDKLTPGQLKELAQENGVTVALPGQPVLV